MIVVDTMILAYMMVNSPFSADCHRLKEVQPDWCVPRYAEVELMNVIWQHLRRGDLDFEGAAARYRVGRAMAQAVLDVDDRDVLRIAYDLDCSVHDARFVSLARESGVPLVTYNKNLLAKAAEALVPGQLLPG